MTYLKKGTLLNHADEKPPKIFFGWWTVLFTGILSGLGHGFYWFGISVFFKDLALELGLSRAVTSVATGIGRLQTGITSPLAGWLADKYGSRWVIFTGVLLAGMGMVSMTLITTVESYILVWGLLTGIGVNVGLVVAVDKALNDWFINKRGLAQGIKFSLIGVGGVIVLPVVTWLVTWQGWRISCLIWGVMLLAGAPLALIFVKQGRPENYGMLPDGAKSFPGAGSGKIDMIARGVDYASTFREREFTFKQAVRTQAYWMLTVALGIHVVIYGGVIIHAIPFLTDIGIDRTTAGTMMGIMVFFTIPGRLIASIIADRVEKDRLKFLLTGAFLLQGAAIVAYLIGRSMISIYIFLILYGFSSATIAPLTILILGRYFGRKAFGSIFGSALAILAPLSLVSPIFTGWVYDTTGDYVFAFTLFASLTALASLSTCLIRPTRAMSAIRL